MNDSDANVKEIVLHDVESVLKQKLGDQIIVDNFTTMSLLPPGENYGSTIYKVDVDYRKNNGAQKEVLNLIAKMLPPTEFQRRIFESSRTFCKEIFMYDTIMPAYNKLEFECGLKKDEIFDGLAGFYGARLSIQPDVEFDDNAVILMDNLKVKGYYNGDRFEGYDLDHSKIAVKALARFHALGMAMKQKKPGIFEMFKMHAKGLESNEEVPELLQGILKLIQADPEITMYHDKCKKIFMEEGKSNLWSDVHREPWTTIIHCDFWVNNILFHKNHEGQIDDIKLVDFQIYVYSSPLRDLLFYLFTSVNINVTDEELEGLMDLYYDTLVNVLNKMGCDTTKLTKEGFRTKMSEDAAREFSHICFLLKVITLNVKDIDFDYSDVENLMLRDGGSSTYHIRLRKIISYFVNHDWI